MSLVLCTGCTVPFNGPTPSPYPASVGFTLYRFSRLQRTCTTPWHETGFTVYGWEATLRHVTQGRIEHRLQGYFLLVEQTDGHLTVPGLSLQLTYPQGARVGVEGLAGVGWFPAGNGEILPLPAWLGMVPYVQQGPWRIRVKAIPTGLTLQYAPGGWDAFLGIHIPTYWMWFVKIYSTDCFEETRYRPSLTLGLYFSL
ncbi:MAG: hypothetical protein L3J76_06115 [Candidatus Hydrothermae bacterium]|nr:hypothetical protein [Candidatus Hydrothermae bacterium]